MLKILNSKFRDVPLKEIWGTFACYYGHYPLSNKVEKNSVVISLMLNHRLTGLQGTHNFVKYTVD